MQAFFTAFIEGFWKSYCTQHAQRCVLNYLSLLCLLEEGQLCLDLSRRQSMAFWFCCLIPKVLMQLRVSKIPDNMESKELMLQHFRPFPPPLSVILIPPTHSSGERERILKWELGKIFYWVLCLVAHAERSWLRKRKKHCHAPYL